jgi:undecaprenyl-diphosphatase
VRTSIDVDVAQWCADHRVDVLDDVAVWLVSASALLGLMSAAAVVWVCVALWFGGWRPMITAVLVLAAVTSLTAWLKPVIDRPRPPADLALTQVTSSSMPSTVAIITSSIVVAIVMTDWWVSDSLRRAVAILGAVGCLVIGAAMLYMGVHWLSDVLVGWGLGSSLTWALMRAAGALDRRMRTLNEP